MSANTPGRWELPGHNPEVDPGAQAPLGLEYRRVGPVTEKVSSIVERPVPG